MRKLGLALLVVLAVCPLALSQVATASVQSPSTAPSLSGQTSSQTSIQTFTLGNSAVVLTGPWKFQPGDSPVVDGAPLWAQPAFDDAHWAPMDLTSQDGAVDLLIGTPGYVPGWTSKGYPDLSGYAWYRLSLRVKDATQPLWLKIPNGFDDAFQLYANGRLIGHFGEFTATHVTAYDAEPVSFPLPAPGPDGKIDLAIRFYLTASSQFGNPDVGGLHGAPVLGLASTVQLLQASDKDALLHSQFGGFLATFLYMLVIPLALGAWLYNRQERVWMWLFFALAWTALVSVTVLLSNMTTLLSLPPGTLILLVELPLWIMFWWYWFGLSEMRWIPRAAWLLAGVITLLEFCANSPYFGLNFIPLTALHWFNAAAVWVGVSYQLLLLLILVEGFRRDRTEALLAAFPILLSMYGSFSIHLLTAFHVRGSFFPFGLGITVRTIVNILLVVTIGALALRRFMRTRVNDSLIRQSEKKDLEQAQQLQQRVLVPDPIHSSVFSIESEYRPALTVGGDFYQTLSRPDGTLVLVIGDVSGKGISAAMLVAVLVGAIRSQAEHTSDPALMLATLNRRMMGRSGGHFATCLVAEISPSGIMRIANAGHISPYRNGEELELEGSLPLGIAEDVAYGILTVTLNAGDHLTFITDGVIEATNPAKELFGFDRTRDISNQPAAAIMDQVLTFGQEDDITVLGIQFAIP